ncbi:3,4-dihydroxy 2-butanone 4-phosphate synthase / GTP cyclohydrolase II [Verrucomicrobium sp. GAS474]|uniref:bifunctional 3,4-dihydroxy-2-butanone-4-phosphate synthase/GTP cyclohydrolase II n=1 Tax=Verrucomicrobium sp. GAS474 TaxID=1882831 RepID=UPI00087A35D6|nr:bifunctional 3,4-dihydroxy-2-butanone-4-phosphate synthase/GTP cyclohydrolase II [Verrucomicrobium sp. GAS474]SDT85794.1 3,4-dihydroxy 2-butanone 4-phosphate synthase / GTP cyclohydrolase II [Verrucomicrobium sp. GAS474]
MHLPLASRRRKAPAKAKKPGSGPAPDSIPDILDALRRGKIVVVSDDENRENEGDLVAAAQGVTAETINFMARHGRGLICAPITRERAALLGIPRMVAENRESMKTDFTVSIDAARGITTGISAADRARTIGLLADPRATKADLVQPGHIFPLQAKPGGVLQRAGHTEAAVDLMRLAGLDPSAVICEILGEDGAMARLPALRRFAARHGLKRCTIGALIEYRRRTERLVRRIESISLPTDHGPFTLHLYASDLDGAEHIALVRGDLPDPAHQGEPVLVRVHSECLTGDVFGSNRCDCGSQLDTALAAIARAGRGVLLYMRQEGRGIGLRGKIRAYKLQEEGLDTVEANLRLGYGSDLREYGLGAQILADLGLSRIRLLTNNPKKIVGLAGYGLEIAGRVPIRISANKHNRTYLETKRRKLGHLL